MHWLVFGCGGVGGYFGGRLEQAGEKVTWLVRGRTLEVLKKDGLKVYSIAGDFHLPTLERIVDTNNLPKEDLDDKADVILLACKTWQAVAAIKQCSPWMTPKTLILPLQNGVEGLEELQAVCNSLSRGHVLCGYCNIVSAIQSPGVINHWAAPAYIAYGEPDNARTDGVLAMEAAFAKCPGMKGQLAEDIFSSMWEKFSFISTTSAINAATGATQDQIAAIPELREMWLDGMKEAIAVARALGVKYQDEWIDKRLGMLQTAIGASTSMARDMNDGAPSELEDLCGGVVRLGKKVGVPTPTHSSLFRLLMTKERKNRRLPPFDQLPEGYVDIKTGSKILGVICGYKGQKLPNQDEGHTDPVVFVAPTTCYLASGGKVVVPAKAEMLHEIELGLVIGKTVSKVPEEDAMDAVAGYVTILDMTAANFGFEGMRQGFSWTENKCYDTWKPVGSFIPKSLIPNPHAVELFLNVNGQPAASGKLSDLKFSLAKLVSYLSHIMVLRPGDVIMSGCPQPGPSKIGDELYGGIVGLDSKYNVSCTLVGSNSI